MTSRFSIWKLICVLSVLVLSAAFALWWWLGAARPGISPYSCTSRGKAAFDSARGFVSENLPNATNFEVVTYDCEDGGPAALHWISSDSQTTVEKMLVSEAECNRLIEPNDPGVGYFLCANGRYFYVINISRGAGEGVKGELDVSWT